MEKKKFSFLSKKYGKYSSWAVWDDNPKNITSTKVITENYKILHSNYVIIGTNKSIEGMKGENWQNFRGKRRGSHDRKLVMAFNCKPFKGSYMTDLFKTTAKSVKDLKLKIKTNNLNISRQVSFFKEEMLDINATNKTKYIIFGKFTSKMFEKHFKNDLNINPKNIFYYEHYSSTHKSDKKWLKGLYSKLKNSK